MMISIIVTAYNQESCIEKCLESISNQTIKDLEIIIIDDGSSDQTSFVCKKIMQKDSRVHYFYQENQGVSMARNYGISLANGQWIAFVDGDDIIPENMIEKLLDAAIQSQCRISCCDTIKLVDYDFSAIHPDQRRPTPFLKETTVLKGQELWKCFFDQWHNFIFWHISNKLFQASLIKGKTFDTRYYMGEDLLYMYQLLKEEGKMVVVPEVRYGYIVIDHSASHSTQFLPQRFQSIEISQWIEKDMEQCDLSNYAKYATENVTRQMSMYVFDYGRHKKMVNQEDAKHVRQVQYLLQRQYRKGIPFFKWLLAAYYPQGIKIKDYLRR